MIRVLVVLLFVIFIPHHVLAGFKFFGAGGQYMAPIQEDHGQLLSLTGPGSKSKMVELRPGAHAVHFDSQEALGIRLKNNKGRVVKDISTSSAGAGGATWEVSNPGWYTLEIEGDVGWRVQLERGFYSEPAEQVVTAEAQPQPFSDSPPPTVRGHELDDDDVDMTGVEWRQSRGAYSGRADQTTNSYGYRAGKYRLEYRYNAHRHFAIWLHSRRGLHELLVNQVGSADTALDFVLPKDDEVWFEVESPFGNWEFTFERKN